MIKFNRLPVTVILRLFQLCLKFTVSPSMRTRVALFLFEGCIICKLHILTALSVKFTAATTFQSMQQNRSTQRN